MDSMISALYQDGLHLHENHIYEHPDESFLLESFQQTMEWLQKAVNGEKEREWFNDLADIQKKLLEQVAYDKFREGFTLGMSLAMEACYGSQHLGE